MKKRERVRSLRFDDFKTLFYGRTGAVILCYLIVAAGQGAA
jgi:hypothetical protein